MNAMNTANEVLAIAVFVAVRLGIPVALMGGLAWAMHQLDRRWQQRGRAQRLQEVQAHLSPAVATPTGLHCWEERDCPPAKRDNCPVYMMPTLPCWLVRRDVEGCLPEACFACALFKRTVAKSVAVVAGD